MKKTALLALASIAIASPSPAKSHHHHHHPYRHHVYAEKSHHRPDTERSHYRGHAEKPARAHAHITCQMVRAYVAQVGLVQARAMAQSHGMTAAEERRAMHCLQSGA